jgi:alpha-beta hydrolase superfamily lysophospholipase
VLYVLCHEDMFVADDLVSWYTERGFHFYVADLRAGRPSRDQDWFPGLDASSRQLRDGDGAEMILVSAHADGALTAALWCDARREAGLADALILSVPVLGRRLRRGLDITCPVLVMCPAADSEARSGRARSNRGLAGLRRRGETAVRMGAHVTWLLLDAGLPGQAADSGDGRSQFFDEMGRWLGAYMYGKVRDQLL